MFLLTVSMGVAAPPTRQRHDTDTNEGSCMFNRTLESFDCPGLRSHNNCSNLQQCREMCCDEDACDTYQFNSMTGGCMLGMFATGNCTYANNTTSWIGEGAGKDLNYSRDFIPRITATYTHDPSAFTEGLFFFNDELYESTGLATVFGCCSSLRRVELETGMVLEQFNLSTNIFAEGITPSPLSNSVVQLTYQSGRGYTYTRDSLKLERNFSLPAVVSHQGWGLTNNGTHLIMSDGTEWLYFIDPSSLKETARRRMFFKGEPLKNINELEWDPTNQELLANLWYYDYWKIARIKTDTGTVIGWYDFSALKSVDVGYEHDVFNGIAVDENRNKLMVTGKWFNKLFVTDLPKFRW